MSWYPTGLADSEGHNVDSLIPLLLDAADKQKLKVFIIKSLASVYLSVTSLYGHSSQSVLMKLCTVVRVVWNPKTKIDFVGGQNPTTPPFFPSSSPQ